MISWDSNRCAACKTPKPIHDDLIRRHGAINYILPKYMTAKFIFRDDPFPLEDMMYDVKICREFIPQMQIFDKDGNLVLGLQPAPHNNIT